MVMMVVVVMVMMAAAMMATTAMVPATAMMPATVMATTAMVPAAAMAVTGLGARQCQPSAKPGSGIELVHLIVIDIHAQADRKGQSGYSVFNSK